MAERDVKVQVRMSAAMREALSGAAERRGVSMSTLIRDQLGGVLGPVVAPERRTGLKRPKGREEPVEAARAAEGAPEATVPELTPRQVAGRLRMPVVLVERFMAAGRIEVRDGKVFFDGRPA